jgi:hypothetical protein
MRLTTGSGASKKPRAKYNSRKTTTNGKTFDSKKEAKRYEELLLLEKAGVVKNLRLQVNFELVPKTKGERAVKYYADFVYEEDGRTVVEDVKGCKTQVYIIKRKLMKWRFPEYEFRET